ncbi:MFS transporter [Shimazuella sp. AN120528]|nr:MFS transporter [Shimazuella soli]
MVIYLQSLHLNEEQIGWIVGIGWIMGAFGGPVIGYFSDRWNSKKLYQFILAIWALTFFGFSLSTNFFVLILLVVANGLCRCVMDVILLDRIFLVVLPSDRSRVANYNFIALTSAMALGPLVGSLVTPISLLFVWVGVGLSCLVVLDLLWREPLAVGERKQLPALKDTVRVLYQDRTLFWYVIAGLIFFTIFIQLETTLPIVLKEQSFDFYAILYAMKSAIIVFLLYFVYSFVFGNTQSMCGYFFFHNHFIPILSSTFYSLSFNI